jgi:hypothetical protein
VSSVALSISGEDVREICRDTALNCDYRSLADH